MRHNEMQCWIRMHRKADQKQNSSFNGSCFSGTTASCTKIVVNDDVIGNVTTNGTLTAPQGCSSVTCPIGETCEERSVQCFRAPCPNIVTCVPNDTNKNSTVRGGCDVVKCNKDETCREESVQCLMAPCPVQVSCVRLVARNSSTTTRPTSNGCPSNQTMLQCLNSCSEKKCPGMENNLLCTKHCSTGCGCSTGYLRSNDGECYKSADCPLDQLCDENEGYRCSTCEGTCKNPNPNCGGKKKCSKACVCAPGFVRKNGKCVTLKTCPSHDHGNTTCLGTQDYTDCLPKCSQLCTGAQDCDSSGNQTTCTAGCVCRGSYKLDSNGECVHNRHCFKSTDCATNEEWSKCLDDEKKCSSSSTDHKPQRDQCFSGCVCSEGFARASNGTCVDENEC